MTACIRPPLSKVSDLIGILGSRYKKWRLYSNIDITITYPSRRKRQLGFYQYHKQKSNTEEIKISVKGKHF